MNTCKFFTTFFINDNHDDVDICALKMSKYFGATLRNNTKIFCCPKCLVAVQTTFSNFIEIHEHHLELFISKTKMVVIKDYLEQHNQLGSGKRKVSPSNLSRQINKKLKHCPTVVTKSDLSGSHIVLISDLSSDPSPDINIPNCMLKELKNQIKKLGSAKIQLGLVAQFTKDDGELKSWYLSNKSMMMSDDFISDGVLKLKEKIENYTELSSGWRINLIEEVNMKITKTSNIINTSGSSYIMTPSGLFNTLSVINVKNKDNLCFLYSILSVIHHNDIPSNKDRATKYTPYLHELKYKLEWFPMKLVDIHRFEQVNPNLAINIFQYNENALDSRQFDEEIYKNPYVDIIYRSKSKGRQIYLVLLEDKSDFHYIGVTNLNRLLNFRNEGRPRIQSHWCEICLHGFQREQAYNQHVGLCKKDIEMTTLYSMPEDKLVMFKDWSKTMKQPFVIYADFESILIPNVIHHQKHAPIASGSCLMLNGVLIQYVQFYGSDCVIEFLKWIEEMNRTIVKPWYEANSKKQMKQLTSTQWSDFVKSTTCYLCHLASNELVRDHDHFTGNYIGAACKGCNLSRQVRPNLSVVFHNLRGYDMHHILKYAISKFKTWDLSCIPQSMEKFMALIVHIKKLPTIRFIDSYMFLLESLSKLALNLTNLPYSSATFDMTLMGGKGIFPYDFATSLEVLETTESLPPIWPGVSEEEYDKAQLVWHTHNCTNLLGYMLVYMHLDVLLLTDIFETFRTTSLEEDGLEPLSFFSIPGMSYASAIKQLENPIELITDPEMYNFFDKAKRGGMTFVNKHHAISDEETELLYVDANNLYGLALSQKLPYSNLEWVDDKDFSEILRKCGSNFKFEDDVGYTLEVDLFIPDEIHDLLDDLPVAPELLTIPGSKNQKLKKLLLTHSPKSNYILHCCLLQVFMSLGVQVTKVHRIVKFKQMEIFQNYIQANTTKRSATTDEFKRSFFKLKNNSLYGKMVENLKKRLNIRLCNNERKMVTYCSKPQFRRSMVIDDDLIAILLAKDRIVLDRPNYIGQTVLDLSKVRMYQLQYYDLQKYRNLLGCTINIVAGDTDSFFLEVKNISLRDVLLPMMIQDQLLDTSNYDPNDPLFSNAINSVIGKIKDESKGNAYKEWIFLRPKCYCLSGNIIIMKAKGIHLKDTTITFQSYLDVYNNNTILTVPQIRIGSINHQLFTFKMNKIALRNLDDKRIWTAKNKSVAYGHYSIRDVGG